MLRQLRQVRERIVAIELKVASLSQTDIAKLKAKSDAAANEGRDLLAEMATSVIGRVEVARQLFEQRSANRAGR